MTTGPEARLVILLMVIISIVAVSLMLKSKKPKIPSESEVAEPPPAEETEIPEPPETTMLCTTCGFEIEPGAPCPFCVDTPEIPEPPKPEPKPEQQPEKVAISQDEILTRLEQAFKDGKISEEQYLQNLAKFKKS